jgi:hypothetical protein
LLKLTSNNLHHYGNMVSKNVNNKKCAPKLIFFNEKKIEKDSDNFWHRKLTLKVKRLGDIALFDAYPLTQFSKFNNFIWVCWFLGKNLSNFVPPVWKLNNPYCHIHHCAMSAFQLVFSAHCLSPHAKVHKKKNAALERIWPHFVVCCIFLRKMVAGNSSVKLTCPKVFYEFSFKLYCKKLLKFS